MLRKRNPAAVQVLEDLQQQERMFQGNSPITDELVIKTLREGLMQRALLRLDPSEMIAGYEAAEQLVEQQLAEILERTNVTDPEQWSRYEEPFTRIQIGRVCEQVEAAFARRGWVLPELPVVGTLSTGQIAAQVQPATDDTVVILIDNAFFKFAGVMSQLCLWSEIEAQSGVPFTEASLQALADLVSTHAFLHSCLYMNPRASPQDQAVIVDLLQHAVMVFVLAHEYAHIAAADIWAHHNDGREDAPIDLRARELEADRKAALTVVEVIDAAAAERGLGGTGPGIMAPFIFLAGLDILTRAEDAVAGKEPAMESVSPELFPTCYERTKALLELCESDPDLQPVAQQARMAARSYLRLFKLYQRMHRLVIDAREEFGPLKVDTFGTPTNPGYIVPSVIGDFWDRVWADFTGAARGDTVQQKVRAMSNLMRELGANVPDFEELIRKAPLGPVDRSGEE